jgi:predicted RNA-binding Zn ribbon-like protein
MRPDLLAVDFANTVSCAACRVGDALARPSEFDRWMRSHARPMSAHVEHRALDRLRLLRADLRYLLDSSIHHRAPPASSLRRVNAEAAHVPSKRSLSWKRGSWVVTEVPMGMPSWQRFATTVARATVELLSGPSGSKLMACQGTGCAHFVLARARRQKWCSATGCGNRARAARHYQKAKAGRLSPPLRVGQMGRAASPNRRHAPSDHAIGATAS